MIRVEIEVRGEVGTRRFDIRACSISRAVELLSDRYPAAELRVVFPIRPETFFAADREPASELGELLEWGEKADYVWGAAG